MKIPIHDCGKDGSNVWVMLKDWDDKKRDWTAPKMKIRMTLSPDRVNCYYPNYVIREGDSLAIATASFIYKIRKEGIDDTAVHMQGKYGTAKDRKLEKRKLRAMGNIKYTANLVLAGKDSKPSEMEPKIVLGLKELKTDKGKPLIKRVRLNIEKDSDKGDCVVVLDDSFDKDLDMVKLSEARGIIFKAFEEVEGVVKVSKFEPTSPKDEN